MSELIGTLSDATTLSGSVSYGTGSGGTSDYERLINKPSINGVELEGDISGSALGLASKNYVDSEVAKKADKTYVDTGLSSKQDVLDEDSVIYTKTIYTNGAINVNQVNAVAVSSEKEYVHECIEVYNKDNTTERVKIYGKDPAGYNNGSIQASGGVYADYVNVNTAVIDTNTRISANENGLNVDKDVVANIGTNTHKLSEKADKTYVDTELASKQDILTSDTAVTVGNLTATTITQSRTDSEGTTKKVSLSNGVCEVSDHMKTPKILIGAGVGQRYGTPIIEFRVDGDEKAVYQMEGKSDGVYLNKDLHSTKIVSDTISSNSNNDLFLQAGTNKKIYFESDVNANFYTIGNVAPPTNDLDAATKKYVDTQVGKKQDKLTAGDNITIVDNVISATGGGGGSTDIQHLTQAQYDALTPEEKSSGDYIIDDADGTVVSIEYKDNVYSTEEKVVGEWIDGKPLYQKTWQLTSPSSTSVTTYSNLMDSTSQCIDYSAMIITSSKSCVMNGISSTSIVFDIWNNGVAHGFNSVVSSALTNLPMYITAKYTKTTD